MKLLYTIFGIVILVVMAIAVWKLRQNAATQPVESVSADIPKSQPIQPQNVYLELRFQALNFPADRFDVDPVSEMPIVYGVVMDWNLGEGIVTFTSFSSGDASMYTSSGGGVIGGVEHESVKNAAKLFVRKAQQYLPIAQKSDDIAAPGNNQIKFFLLTNRGRFTAIEEIENFDNGSSNLLELFVEANKVISELRTTSERVRK